MAGDREGKTDVIRKEKERGMHKLSFNVSWLFSLHICAYTLKKCFFGNNMFVQVPELKMQGNKEYMNCT